MKTFKYLFVVLVCQSLIFTNLLWAAEQLSLPSPDITAPEGGGGTGRELDDRRIDTLIEH